MSDGAVGQPAGAGAAAVDRPRAGVVEVFSADPRIPDNQTLRASDADRDLATQLIAQARAAGRIDAAEFDARGFAVARARTLGDLAPHVSDLMVADAVQGFAARTHNRFAKAGVQAWIGLAVLLNAIWLMTVLTSGHLLYYWPMWAMVGTAIPVAMALFWPEAAGDEARQRAERDAREARRGTRHRERLERRAARDQRRALRHGDTPALPPPPVTPAPDDDLR